MLGVAQTQLVIIGSNSIHTRRYITALLQNSVYTITIITNQSMAEFANLSQHIINFSYYNLLAYRQIRRIICTTKAKVVHIHQANSYAWHGVLALKGNRPRPKVILTVWGSDVLLVPQQSWALALIVKFCLARADVITANSHILINAVQKLLPSQRVSRSARWTQFRLNRAPELHLLHFGIENIPAMQDLSSKAKLILSSRLHKKLYHVDKIILAFAKLVRNGVIDQEYKLIIAGTGPETKNLQQMIYDLNLVNKVYFTAMLNYNELVKYYQRATVFVSVPESDALASSVLEAMAYGCIPVLSSLASAREVVLDKINGFIGVDYDLLADAILNAVHRSANLLEYQQLYKINYRLVQEKGSTADNILEFLKLYE